MPRSILRELKNYLSDALPGGALNPELTTDVNASPTPRALAMMRSFLGEAPDELGISALNPRAGELRRAAEPAFAAGTVLQVAPLMGGLKTLAGMTRTGRNVGRVMRGTDPLEAALQEIKRVSVPYERAAASSPRGWVGPVEVGDLTGVGMPRSSRLRKASSVTHTHPRQGEFGSYAPMSPADRGILEGQPVDMNVVHTAYDTGAPTRYRESMRAGSLPPQITEKTPVSDYLEALNATEGYSSNVPRYLRDVKGHLNPEDYSSVGLKSTPEYRGGDLGEYLQRVRDHIYTVTDHKSPAGFENQEQPRRFYRTMAAMVKGGEGSPLDFDDLTREYLESRPALDSIESLTSLERPSAALGNNANMRRGSAWAASNPLTAASYMNPSNAVTVPLELIEKPGAVFDASGLPWNRFFSQTGRVSNPSRYPLNSEYRDALMDPSVKSILVKNIYDQGMYPDFGGVMSKLSEAYGLPIKNSDLISDNLLIKDPSVVRYLLSGEIPKMKTPKSNYARGGLAQMKECACRHAQ